MTSTVQTEGKSKVLRALQDSVLFFGLSPEALEKIYLAGKIGKVPKNAQLTAQTKGMGFLNVIVEGHFQVVRATSPEQIGTLDLKDGYVFGEIDAQLKMGEFQTAKALSDSLVFTLSKEAVENLRTDESVHWNYLKNDSRESIEPSPPKPAPESKGVRGDRRLKVHKKMIEARLLNGTPVDLKDVSQSGLFIRDWKGEATGEPILFLLRSRIPQNSAEFTLAASLARSDSSGAGFSFAWKSPIQQQEWLQFFEELSLQDSVEVHRPVVQELKESLLVQFFADGQYGSGRLKAMGAHGASMITSTPLKLGDRFQLDLKLPLPGKPPVAFSLQADVITEQDGVFTLAFNELKQAQQTWIQEFLEGPTSNEAGDATQPSQPQQRLTSVDFATVTQFSEVFHREMKNGVLNLGTDSGLKVGQPVAVSLKVPFESSLFSSKRRSFVLNGKVLRVAQGGAVIVKFDTIAPNVLQQLKTIAGKSISPQGSAPSQSEASPKSKQARISGILPIVLFILMAGLSWWWMSRPRAEDPFANHRESADDAPRFQFVQDLQLEANEVPYREGEVAKTFSTADLDFISFDPVPKKFTFFMKDRSQVPFEKSMVKYLPGKLIQALLSLNPTDPYLIINPDAEKSQ